LASQDEATCIVAQPVTCILFMLLSLSLFSFFPNAVIFTIISVICKIQGTYSIKKAKKKSKGPNKQLNALAVHNLVLHFFGRP
jgi:type III secretory pathway component EscV